MRIACVLADEFEDTEFRVPYDRLRAAGHEVTVIGARAGEALAGHNDVEHVATDVGIDEVEPDDFDALLIPGGYSPDKLRADPRFVRFARAFAAKPIFAICHGPQLLLTADLVRGRTLTAWSTVQVDLRAAGADAVDRQVVVDGNLVTSRMPDDAEAFSAEALRMLQPEATASPS